MSIPTHFGANMEKVARLGMGPRLCIMLEVDFREIENPEVELLRTPFGRSSRHWSSVCSGQYWVVASMHVHRLALLVDRR